MNDPLVPLLILNTLIALGLGVTAHACGWARVRPQIVHGLWLAALVKLILPSFVPVPVWPAATARKAEVTSMRIVTVERMPPSTPSETREAPLDGAVLGEVGSVAPAWRVRPWVMGVWAAGSVGWVMLALWRMRRFHRLLGSAVPMTDRHPRVYLIDAAISPMLWAFWGRARIILPKALVESFSAAELEAVLQHERIHFRRRDHWVRWVEFVVLAIVWWHPLAWWISRQLRAAEEACCDTEVAADVADRRPYATALLRTALFLSSVPAPPRHATGIGEAASIKKRVESIMIHPAPRGASKLATLSFLSLTAMAVVATPVERPTPSSGTVAHAPGDGVPESVALAEVTEAVTDSATTDLPPAPQSPVLPPPPAGSRVTFSAEKVYLDGYIKVQQAEGRQKAGDPGGATKLFREALVLFESVRAAAPKWQPQMVHYRIGLVRRQLGLESPPPLPFIETTIQNPVPSVSSTTQRVGLRTEFGGRLLRVVADHLQATTPDSLPGRALTTRFAKGETSLSGALETQGPVPAFVGTGTIRAGWGKWQIVAEKVELLGTTMVLSGDPVLVVLDSEKRATTILKGRRMTLDLNSQTLVVAGDAVGFFDRSLGSFWSAEGEEESMKFFLSKDGQTIKPMVGSGAKKYDLNLRERARGEHRSRLLEKWPGSGAIEAELAPLLPGAGKPIPSPPWPGVRPEVDGPRQEPIPKEGTPPKKLPV